MRPPGWGRAVARYLMPPSYVASRDFQCHRLAYILLVRVHQGKGFSNTIVFNPWTEGKKGPVHPDFDDDGYKVYGPASCLMIGR